MRASRLLIGSFVIAMSYPMSAPATAQTSTRQPAACVDVAVNDHPALSYACLNQRLAASAQPEPGPQVQLDPVTHAPGNQQLGQFNQSALSIRMGSNLGRSVNPQRPPPPAPSPLLGVPAGAH